MDTILKSNYELIDFCKDKLHRFVAKFQSKRTREILKSREYKQIKKRLRSFKSLEHSERKFSSRHFYNFILPKNDEFLYTITENDPVKLDCSMDRNYSNSVDLSFFRISASSILGASRRRSTKKQSFTDLKNLRARFHDPYTNSPSESEIELFAENIEMIMHRHYTLKIPQHEIKDELNDQIYWLIEECNWRMTLLEYMAIFKIDMGLISVRNFRNEETKDVLLRDSWLNNYYYFRSVNETNFFEVELEWVRVLSHLRGFNVNEMYVICTIFNETKKTQSVPIFKQRKIFLKHIYKEQLDIFNSKKFADIIVEQKSLFRFTLVGQTNDDIDDNDDDSIDCSSNDNIEISLPDQFNSGNYYELANLTLDIRSFMKKLDNEINQKFYFTNDTGENIADGYFNITNIQILRTNILYALTKNDYS